MAIEKKVGARLRLTAEDLKNLKGGLASFHEKRTTDKTLLCTQVNKTAMSREDLELISLALKLPRAQRTLLLTTVRAWVAAATRKTKPK